MISLPGTEKTVRGYAGANLIVCDEAARIDDDLMAALRPMLATVNGSLLMLIDACRQARPILQELDRRRRRLAARPGHAPRVSTPVAKEFLAEELRELGPTMFRQEYELEFLSDAEALFNYAIIAAAFTDEVKPLWQYDVPLQDTTKRETFRHKGKRWERILAEPYQRFTMGVDLGQSQDYTAISMYSITTSRRSTIGTPTRPPARSRRRSSSASTSFTWSACRSACCTRIKSRTCRGCCSARRYAIRRSTS